MDMDTGYNIEKEEKRKSIWNQLKANIYIPMSDFFFIFFGKSPLHRFFFFSNWNYLLKKLKLKK